MISTLKCAGQSGTAGTVPPKCQVAPSPSVTVRPAISVHTVSVSVSAPAVPCPFFLHLADRPALLLPLLRLSLASFTCELAAAALAKAPQLAPPPSLRFPLLSFAGRVLSPQTRGHRPLQRAVRPRANAACPALSPRLATCGRVTDAFLLVPTGMSPLGSGVGLAVPQAPGSPSEVLRWRV